MPLRLKYGKSGSANPISKMHAPLQVPRHMNNLHKTRIDHVGIYRMRIKYKKNYTSDFWKYIQNSDTVYIIKRLRVCFIHFHRCFVPWCVLGISCTLCRFSLHTGRWLLLLLSQSWPRYLWGSSCYVHDFFFLLRLGLKICFEDFCLHWCIMHK